MRKEWANLRSKNVWYDYEVREWDDVVREVHFGYLHGILMMRNGELPEGDPITLCCVPW